MIQIVVLFRFGLCFFLLRCCRYDSNINLEVQFAYLSKICKFHKPVFRKKNDMKNSLNDFKDCQSCANNTATCGYCCWPSYQGVLGKMLIKKCRAEAL